MADRPPPKRRNGEPESSSWFDRRRIVQKLKSAPGVVGAAVLTAIVGAGAAYFVPKILDEATGKNNLKVSVETNPLEIDTFDDLSQTVIVPNGLTVSGGPGGQGCLGFHDWATSTGGVPAGRTDLRLIAQAAGTEILISGIRARIVDRNPPLRGTALRCPSAGVAEIRNIQIPLDDPDPSGHVLKGGEERPVAFTVGANNTEIFDITVWTEQCHCTWVLELVTTQAGEQEIVEVTNHGEAFQTTAWGTEPLASLAASPGPFYDWDWVEGDSWSLQRDGLVGPEYSATEPLPPVASVTVPNP